MSVQLGGGDTPQGVRASALLESVGGKPYAMLAGIIKVGTKEYQSCIQPAQMIEFLYKE